jgi:hypothetical protein
MAKRKANMKLFPALISKLRRVKQSMMKKFIQVMKRMMRSFKN